MQQNYSKIHLGFFFFSAMGPEYEEKNNSE